MARCRPVQWMGVLLRAARALSRRERKRQRADAFCTRLGAEPLENRELLSASLPMPWGVAAAQDNEPAPAAWDTLLPLRV
jgi:hypothetical protein